MKRARHQQGSVVFDKRRGTWQYLWRENGGRRTKVLGSKRDLPTKSAAWSKVKADGVKTSQQPKAAQQHAPNVLVLVEQYRKEKMPIRYSTRYGYDQWLQNHIVPRWGESPLSDLQPRPVDLWLQSLALSAKSKSHIRALLRILWNYAMYRGDMPTQLNPMELVRLTGVTKRTRKPRSLTADEFQRFVAKLDEPNRTLALVCVCFGLRISEALALKWEDVDWLNQRLLIRRGIVRKHVDAVKTSYSEQAMSISTEIRTLLNARKQATEFSAATDWIFASPSKLGRAPLSYGHVWRVFHKAGTDVGINSVGPHSLRHTYRSWLDAVGTPVAVQQKMMRHGDIRTTMNTYGDVVTDEMQQAHRKVVGLALSQTAN